MQWQTNRLADLKKLYREKLTELYDADEVFMTGTTKKVLPVSRVNDHVFSNGKPGMVTEKLKTLYKEFENSITTLPNPGNQG